LSSALSPGGTMILPSILYEPTLSFERLIAIESDDAWINITSIEQNKIEIKYLTIF